MHELAGRRDSRRPLDLGPVRAGVRTYLAVAGGLAVPPVLGSRSTDLLSGLGPAPLRAGDRLALGAARGAPGFTDLPVLARLPGPSGIEVRLHPGPRLDWFTPAALGRLVDGPWTTTSRSDRTGVAGATRASASISSATSGPERQKYRWRPWRSTVSSPPSTSSRTRLWSRVSGAVRPPRTR